MTKILKLLFHLLIVRPLVLVVIGINVRGRMNLPKKGPAILAANHNSHLDTLILQSLFPLSMQSNIRPVAAADYFMRYRWLAWFSVNVMGILPIQRKLSASSGDPLSGCIDALGDGQILIVFPEGSRGEAEKVSDFKNGVAHLAKKLPETPVYPIFLHGCGKALPKGEAIFVPFFVDAVIGEPRYWSGNKTELTEILRTDIETLSEQCDLKAWE
mgnify:CR=1 FL=1